MANFARITTLIRFQIGQLLAHNRQHTFEEMCFWIAKLRICKNVLPATGPVGAGGDQGRDFETFRTHLRKLLATEGHFTEWANTGMIAFACSLTQDVIPKVKADVLKIKDSGVPVSTIVFFSSVDIPVGKRHSLEEWAKKKHAVSLEIHDAQQISQLLSEKELWWIATEYLALPFSTFEHSTGKRSSMKLVKEQKKEAIRDWHGNRVITHYYLTYIESWGIPLGILPVEDEKRRRRNSFRFEYQAGRLRRVEAIHPSGKKSFQSVRSDLNASRIDLQYSEEGNLNAKVYFNRFGRIVLKETFSEGGNLITLCGEGGKPLMLDANLTWEAMFTGADKSYNNANTFRYKTKVARKRITYRDDGRVSREIYENIYGERTVGLDGTWGCLRRYDAKGDEVETISLDPSDEPCIDNYGAMSVKCTYDENHCFIEKAFLGSDGAPVIGEGGYAKCVYYNNNDLLQHKMEFFDASGAPMFLPAGYSACTSAYDEAGNLRELRFLDTEGNPTMNQDGHAMRRMEHDNAGAIVGITYFNDKDEIVLCSQGMALIQYERDDDGNPTTEQFYGLDGKPMEVNGVHLTQYKYNLGLCVSTAYYNVHQQPVVSKHGYAIIEEKFDLHGRITECVYRDAEGDLVVPMATRPYARCRRDYNEETHSLHELVFDADNVPTIGEAGVHEVRVKFSPFGTPLDASCFDSNGNPTLNRLGFHRALCEFDAVGHPSEWSWFGISGEPVIMSEAMCHKRISCYDSLWLLTSETTYDVSGNRVIGPKGYAEVCCKYDKGGRRIADDYFGVDGEITLNDSGVAGIRYVFDIRGRIVEQISVGVDGLATNEVGGYAVQRASFDDRNHLVSLRGFAPDGTPVATCGGYHHAKLTWDDRGHNTERLFFGTDEGGCFATFKIGEFMGWPKEEADQYADIYAYFAMARLEYDIQSRLTSISVFAPDGSAVRGIAGAHSIYFEYNSANVMYRMGFLGEDQRPIWCLLGFSRTDILYNRRGFAFERRFYGIEGEPTLRLDSNLGAYCAGHRSAFDEKGRVMSMTLLDTEWNVRDGETGFATVCYSYDTLGREIERYFADRKGREVNNNSGVCHIVSRYDSLGRLVQQWRTSAEKLIIPLVASAAILNHKYNERGKIVESYYFDAHGVLATDDEGVACIGYIFDERGLELERRLYGAGGELVRCNQGFAIWRREYNDAGQMLSTTYLDEGSARVVNIQCGYAVELRAYDHLRRLVKIAYFDDLGGVRRLSSRLGLQVRTITADADEWSLFDPSGDRINGYEGWARRIWSGIPGRLETFNSANERLAGVLRVSFVPPGSNIEELGLLQGDLIVQCGSWTWKSGWDVAFAQRLLSFRGTRLSAKGEEQLVVLRSGVGYTFTVPEGLLGAEIDDFYFECSLLERFDRGSPVGELEGNGDKVEPS